MPQLLFPYTYMYAGEETALVTRTAMCAILAIYRYEFLGLGRGPSLQSDFSIFLATTGESAENIQSKIFSLPRLDCRQ